MIIVSRERWVEEVQPKLLDALDYSDGLRWKLKDSELPGYLAVDFYGDDREELYFRLRFM